MNQCSILINWLYVAFVHLYEMFTRQHSSNFENYVEEKSNEFSASIFHMPDMCSGTQLAISLSS